MLRGALLLAVAALDALVDDLVVEFLPKAILAGKQGGDIAKWVKEAPDQPLAALAAADPATSLAAWVASRHATDSFVNPWKIENVLRDELGCPIALAGADQPWVDTSAILAALGVGWTPQDCRDRLGAIVRRRNDIAHDGDVNAAGRTNSIRRDQVAVAILAIACVGHAVDGVIAAHLP